MTLHNYWKKEISPVECSKYWWPPYWNYVFGLEKPLKRVPYYANLTESF